MILYKISINLSAFEFFLHWEGTGSSWVCPIIWMACCCSNYGKLVRETKTGPHSGMWVCTHYPQKKKKTVLFFHLPFHSSSCTSLWTVAGNLELSYFNREHIGSSSWSSSVKMGMGLVVLCHVHHPCFRRNHSVFFPHTLPGLFVSPKKLTRGPGWRNIKVNLSHRANNHSVHAILLPLLFSSSFAEHYCQTMHRKRVKSLLQKLKTVSDF